MGFRDLINNRAGQRALPALIIFFTLAVGVAIGTLVSQRVRASKVVALLYLLQCHLPFNYLHPLLQ